MRRKLPFEASNFDASQKGLTQSDHIWRRRPPLRSHGAALGEARAFDETRRRESMMMVIAKDIWLVKFTFGRRCCA